MSPNTTPADLFRRLTLESHMSSTSDECRQRAVEVRDVLSSFDREVLPSEYKTDIFANLDRPLTARPQQQSEWTIQQDLHATLLQWGTYDDQAFQIITRLQSPSTRMRCFHEKLSRRFRDIFDEYDVLNETMAHVDDVYNEVDRLAQKFVDVVAAAQDDRQHRELGQVKTAQLSLGALVGVCRRDNDIVLASPSQPATSARRSRTPVIPPASNVSLFRALIQRAGEEPTGGSMILDLLETYSSVVLGTLSTDLRELVAFLTQRSVPTTYLARVQLLSQRAQEHQTTEAATAESDISGNLGTPSTFAIETGEGSSAAAAAAAEVSAVSETRSRTSVKRTASQGTSKRGKKKTTK